MSWFLVPLQCAGPFGLDTREALHELADDLTAVVSVTEGDADPASDRRTFELVLAIDAQDAGAAAARVPAIFAAGPDFEFVSVGEVSESTNPRALGAEALDILRDAADELRDELREDIQTLPAGGRYDDTFAVSEHLPVVYARHYTPELVAHWAGSVETVAHKLAAYPNTYLASTAEELAGHALIGRCEALIDEREEELNDPDAVREKFSEAHDLAFEDHDVLLLFDARFDGIEDSDVGEMMGMANLHVRDWFMPFRSDD
ncbi:MAG: hypothetical protein ACRDM7_09965 [Thermoleophilaceae bacterium]